MESVLFVFRIVFWSIVGVSIIGTLILTQKKRLKKLKLPDLAGAVPKGFWNKIRENWQTVIGFAVLHLVLFWFWQETWWWLVAHPLFWVNHAVILAVFLFLRHPAKEVRGKKVPGDLKFPATWVLLALLVGNIQYIWSNWSIERNLNTPRSDVALSVRNSPLPGENLEGKKRVEDFFLANLEEEDAREMVEICGLESGWNQFERDGKTALSGRENPNDIGVCQINLGWWGKQAESLGHNLYDWDGNLQMALWIRNHHGPEQWNTYKLRARNILVEAPVGQRSERIQTPGWFSIQPEGPIYIFTSTSGERAFESGPEEKYKTQNLGRTEWLEFRSRSGEAVKVTVIPRW